MRRITEIDINDNYFFNNGYWDKTINNDSSYTYVIIIPTEKWRELFDTCIRELPKGNIITPEFLIKIMNGDKLKRTPYKKSSWYIKKKNRINYDY